MSPRPICAVLALTICIGWAEDPAPDSSPEKIPKANASRLIYRGETAFLAKRGTREPSDKPFTGIAFWEGESWRAEVSFKDGIPDGEAVVVANNKVLSRFRYEGGRRVGVERP